MNTLPPRRWPWLAVALLLALTGDAWLARRTLTAAQERFETDARIMHRLLSQRASQHDAVLASLNLFHTQRGDDGREQRLSALYPQILAVAQRGDDARWSGAGGGERALAALDVAWQSSRGSNNATTAAFDSTEGRFWLVRAASPISHALLIDLNMMVPWSDWPGGSSAKLAAAASGTRVSLVHAGQTWLLQPAPMWESPWQFSFRKPLAAGSQPFEVVATQCLGWGDLPWLTMLAWSAFCGVAVAATAMLWGQRRERERTAQLRQMERVSRLNAMGELAGGMAHELNQPLTAVLANTQAAARLLAEQPPDIDAARPAMQRASAQARRAAEVLTRLRRMVSQPGAAQALTLAPQDVARAVRKALFLIEPECHALALTPTVAGDAPLWAMADAVALEQVLHNLLANALTALQHVPAAERRLQLTLTHTADRAVIDIRDSGPGIAAEALAHLFAPFFTTHVAATDEPTLANGLGLGLSLCESLLQRMGGHIDAANGEPRGAVFRVQLPLATSPAEDAE